MVRIAYSYRVQNCVPDVQKPQKIAGGQGSTQVRAGVAQAGRPGRARIARDLGAPICSEALANFFRRRFHASLLGRVARTCVQGSSRSKYCIFSGMQNPLVEIMS